MVDASQVLILRFGSESRQQHRQFILRLLWTHFDITSKWPCVLNRSRPLLFCTHFNFSSSDFLQSSAPNETTRLFVCDEQKVKAGGEMRHSVYLLIIHAFSDLCLCRCRTLKLTNALQLTYTLFCVRHTTVVPALSDLRLSEMHFVFKSV